MMTTDRFTRTTMLLAAVGVVVLAAVALGIARADSQASGDEATTELSGDPMGRDAAASVDRQLTDRFSVLRSPRTASDVMPIAAVDFVRRTGIAGMNPDFSKRVASDGDYELFVVPANDAVCLHAVSEEAPAGAGGTCGEVEAANRGSVVMAGTAEGGVRISGLLPDGIEHAAVVLASGERVETKVVDNVYTTVVGESVKAVSFSVEGTETTLSTPFEMPGG